MIEARVIHKVGLAVFQDGKILMTRDNKNEEVFLFIGGSIEDGENDIDCVKRETQEELGTAVIPDTLEYLGEFSAPAHGKENTVVEIRLYRGELLGEPHPSSEVVELQYFDSSVDPKHLSEIAINHIFPWLKEHKLIS